jgi:DNA-binding transcriptional MocR family regulator
MPKSVDSVQLADEALAKGISLAPGVLFSMHDRHRHCIRLSCGQPWSPQLDRAFETVGRIAQRLLSRAG